MYVCIKKCMYYHYYFHIIYEKSKELYYMYFLSNNEINKTSEYHFNLSVAISKLFSKDYI